MKSSEIIREARVSLIEKGHGKGRLLTDKGAPCLLGALALGAGYELVRGCNRIADVEFSVFRTGTLGAAIDSVAYTINPVSPDPVTTVWWYNDAGGRRLNDVLDVLDRAEILAKEREQ